MSREALHALLEELIVPYAARSNSAVTASSAATDARAAVAASSGRR
jgi:hypothetical protein